MPRRLQNQNGPAHLRLYLRPQDGGGKKTTVLVTGTIRVENIWIQGSLEGTLTADETVTIHRHAKFLGDITARRLIIEEGGTHQGAFTRLT